MGTETRGRGGTGRTLPGGGGRLRYLDADGGSLYAYDKGKRCIFRFGNGRREATAAQTYLDGFVETKHGVYFIAVDSKRLCRIVGDVNGVEEVGQEARQLCGDVGKLYDCTKDDEVLCYDGTQKMHCMRLEGAFIKAIAATDGLLAWSASDAGELRVHVAALPRPE